MKRMIREFTSMILVIALACGIFGAVPVSAASSPKFSKNVTTFLYGKYDAKNLANSHVYYDITIKNCAEKPSNVTISNSKVNLTQVSYSKSKKKATITINTAYTGSTTVKFKVKGKTYSTKVTFKAYSNPAKTVKISGVKSGKNIASKAKNSSQAYASLKKNQSNAKLTVQSNSKWKLTGVKLTDGSNDKTIYSKTYNGTKAKKTLKIGSLKKSKSYVLALTFKNTKNGGKQTIYYYL